MKRFGGATLCYRMLKDTFSCFTQLHFQNRRFDKFSVSNSDKPVWSKYSCGVTVIPK
jgi:hypothetical protein